MRLFIATEFKSEEFSRLRNEFDIKGIKVVGHFHLTWKFLGDVDEKQLPGIIKKLKKIKAKKFKANSTNLGSFPSLWDIQVVLVGLDGKEIIGLKNEIEEALLEIFPKDKRFSAHITLGRVKFINDKKVIQEKLKQEIKKEEFEISDFKLIKSELKPEGPEYTTIQEFKLG